MEIDQLQYELGAVRRRTDTEVCSLRQRIVDLELQVSEARKEADEYYRASVEHNTEAMALANQVIFLLVIIINKKDNKFNLPCYKQKLQERGTVESADYTDKFLFF